jgi:hypothetical protein
LPNKKKEDNMKFNPTPETRRWIYGIIASVVPLLTVLNVISGDVASHILAISAAILSFGGSMLAIRNVPGAEEK